MTPMRERLARRIYRLLDATDSDSWDAAMARRADLGIAELSANHRRAFDLADACLSELETPSEGMVEAGFTAIVACKEFVSLGREISIAYTAMIRAAREDTTPNREGEQ